MARSKVSERTFIDASGDEVERMEQATGARYTLLGGGEGGGDRSFDVQLGTAGSPSTMLAIFGAWTKFGNVANTVLNDKDEPGTPADAAAEIDAFVKGLTEGQWREPSDGAPRAAKYDNAVLAAVLHATLGSSAKGDVAHYQSRLESDKSYRAKVVGRDDIKAAYWAEQQKRGVAKPQASTDSLA